MILMQYAQRGRNAAWRYVLAMPLALFIAAILGAAITLVAVLARIAPTDLADELSRPSHPSIFFAGVGVSFAALLVGFAAAIRLIHGKRFGDVLGAWRWKAVGHGAAIWCAAQALATLADWALEPQALTVSATQATLGLALAATPALAVQTFTEEFIFRGYVTQRLLLAIRRPIPTSLVSGAVFGAVHIANGAPQALGALAFGCVAAYITLRTGSLAFSFGVHLANNLFGSLVVVADSDVFRGAPALLTEHAPGLVWWDLAAEATLLAALAAVIVWRVPDDWRHEKDGG